MTTDRTVKAMETRLTESLMIDAGLEYQQIKENEYEVIVRGTTIGFVIYANGTWRARDARLDFIPGKHWERYDAAFQLPMVKRMELAVITQFWIRQRSEKSK